MQTTTTLLALRFENNSLEGEQGEAPVQAATITFQAGVSGQGLYMDRGNRLTYPSEGNINSTEGTIELWLKPNWAGNDGQNHTIFRYGASNGYMLLGKEGNNLRLALNRANENGGLELDVSTSIENWQTDQWHHVAASWSNTGQSLRLYLDGKLVSERSIVTTLPTISSATNPTFQLGGDSVRFPLLATIDDVNISDGARSAQEIASRMLQSIAVTSATLIPNITSVDMYPGWVYWQDFQYQVTTSVGTLTLPWQVAGLTSSNVAIATIDSLTGRPKAVAPGTATITASFNSLQSVITINVLTPSKAVAEETLDTYLATPATGHLYKIPIAIIRYFPTKNGTNVDATASGYTSTLDALRAKQTKVEKKLKFMLEEGSRFRGYTGSGATPSLGYQVVKIINVYEDIPPGLPTSTSGVYFPDYKQILKRFNAEDLVTKQGVKEIWLEQYVNGRITLHESNMASPVTGDVSNSSRANDDLPVYTKAYTLFGINFAQSENDAARNRGHHLEALLTYANVLQDRDDVLFQESFIGRDTNGAFLQGRCGKTDRPPNSTSNFDFNNATGIESDIEDWFPDGRGTRKIVNNDTWGKLTYAWPETPDGKAEGQWYLYWMQALPGRNNAITRLEAERLTNWWQFTADWDSAMQVKLGLTEALTCQYELSSTSRSVSGNGVSASVNITCGANCKWVATTGESWIKLTNTTGTGNGTVNYTVDPTTVVRTGTIVIGGQVFTITQSNCTITLAPASQTVAASSGSASVGVTVTGGASCPWTATSNASWLTVSSGGSGTANGTVNFTVAANTSLARTATVTIAEQTVTITQSPGCTYALTPTSRSITAIGGSDSVSVQAGTGCAWTATSNDAWLMITSGNSGTGNGTVALTVGLNGGAARIGTLTIGGQTYTVMQAAANPVPTLTSLNPSAVMVGSAAFTLTVNGTNFNNASVVNWNGTPRTTTLVNATQLQAAIPAADVATSGTASVTVTNPAPGGGTTGALSFAINNPAPTLTSLNPTSVVAGSAGFTLTLNGTGFVVASVAQVNGANRTTTLGSSTQLTLNLTAADIATGGTMTLVVVNAAPGGGTSGQQTLTINNPAPTLTSLSQTSALAGSGAFTLTVNGTNFVSASKVRWNGADRTTSFVSSTQLSAIITAADVAAAGTANITVFNAAPSGGTSSALSFAITSVCTYSLAPTSKNFTASGGNGSLTVTAGAGCSWSVINIPAWVTINTGLSNIGSGTVTFTVAANPGPARTGTMSIVGQTFTITQDAAPTCIAQRNLPTTYLPNQAVQVSVQVTPIVGTQSYALEEIPPSGWTISGIDNSGQFDAVNGKVKWGPFFDAQARTLNYTATPPANATGKRDFSGTVSLNGISSVICGKTSIDQGSLSHPADLNDNFRIEINELTAYGSAWKAGTAWSRAPNPIDINYLTNAGLVWKVGELYHYDVTKTPPFAAGATAGNLSPRDAVLSPEERVYSRTVSGAAMTAFSAASYLPTGGMLATIAEALDVATQVYAVDDTGPTEMPTALVEEPTPINTVPAAEEWAPSLPSLVASGTAVASFSAANYTPGVGVTITIVVTPDAATQVYAIEETPPLGWVISNISHSGAFDSTNKKVKLGPFFDNAARTMTYVATPPVGETGIKTFAGSASFDGGSVIVTGARMIAPLGCTYSLGSPNQSFNGGGGTGSFNLAAPNGCSWNATTNDGWVTITQGSGSGNGSVNFSVAANTGAARAGTITVGGQTFTVNQAANTAPTITAASALTRQQGATATAVTIATLGDAETALGDLVVTTTSVPTGISVTALTNTNGTISALVTASCQASVGTNTVGLKVTDAQGASALTNLTVNITSGSSCFLQIADASASDQRMGSVLLYSYYTSSISAPTLQNTQIRITNTHETLDTAVRLYLVDGQFASVSSLFICLPPNQTANFLMSEIDPGVTGYVIAVAVNKTSGCPTNFNYLMGGASIKLSTGHTTSLGAIAIAALATNPTTCSNNVATLNFDGTNYGRLPKMLVLDNVPSLKDNNDTRLMLARVGGSLVNGASALGTISGKIYNSNRTSQDFTFSATTPQFSSSLSINFPRVTTRLDTFIPAGQGGWMRLWTDASFGIIGTVINLPANLRATRAFEGGYNLQQSALSPAVSLDIPISVPTCQ